MLAHLIPEIRQHEKKSHQSDHITVPDTHTHTHARGKTYVRLSFSFASYRDLKDSSKCVPNPTSMPSRPPPGLEPSATLRLAMAATIAGNSLAHEGRASFRTISVRWEA